MPQEGAVFWRRRRLARTFLAALIFFISAGLGYQNMPRLADWYTNFATSPPPQRVLGIGFLVQPPQAPESAFRFCARQVSRKVGRDLSVATFTAPVEAYVGGGRVRVSSYVDEDRADGKKVRWAYECEVEQVDGRWTLARLSLQSGAM